ISLFNSAGRFNDAERYTREALDRFPRDPILILHKAITIELASHYVPPPMRPGRVADRPAPPPRALAAAADEYRRALALDPHLAAARRHLGWIRVQQGDTRARDDLAGALEDAKDDETRYLAHLFRGGAAERRRDFDQAATEYEAAHRIDDRHQTPF